MAEPEKLTVQSTDLLIMRVADEALYGAHEAAYRLGQETGAFVLVAKAGDNLERMPEASARALYEALKRRFGDD